MMCYKHERANFTKDIFVSDLDLILNFHTQAYQNSNLIWKGNPGSHYLYLFFSSKYVIGITNYTKKL